MTLARTSRTRVAPAASSRAATSLARVTRAAASLVSTSLVTASLAATSLGAQSAQPFGVQLAVLGTTIVRDAATIHGIGLEPQFRFNRVVSSEAWGAVSLGIGGQLSSHSRGNDELRMIGLFLEPRWVPPLPSTRVFPYVSARLALLRLEGRFVFAPDGASRGSGVGVGGGVIVRLSRTVNLDGGVQLVRQEVGDIGPVAFRPFTTYAAKLGLTFGLR